MQGFTDRDCIISMQKEGKYMGITHCDKLGSCTLKNTNHCFHFRTFKLVQQKVEFGHMHFPVLQLNAWTGIVCFTTNLFTPHQDLGDNIHGKILHDNKRKKSKYSNDSYSPYLQTSLHSSPLHNKSLQKFGLLHATLLHTGCIHSSFLVTLWRWVKVKVIQNGNKMKSLVMSDIISRLREITS